MRKVLSFILVLCFCISLCGCDSLMRSPRTSTVNMVSSVDSFIQKVSDIPDSHISRFDSVEISDILGLKDGVSFSKFVSADDFSIKYSILFYEFDSAASADTFYNTQLEEANAINDDDTYVRMELRGSTLITGISDRTRDISDEMSFVLSSLGY